MALLLLAVLWLLAAGSLYLFWQPPVWLPALASAEGAAVDRQFGLSYLWVGAVFFTAQFLLGLLVWKYRERAGTNAHYSRGDARAEVVWTVLTAALFLGLSWTGARAWSQSFAGSLRAHDYQERPFQVEVHAIQFAWYFRYPGADGKFGRTRPELRDASGGNEAAIGLDLGDPNAQDDLVTTSLVLPSGRNVVLLFFSQDVIHSFFVPELRFKQDATPGTMDFASFLPNRPGTYEIACAELCGLGHYRMRAALRVVSAEEFEHWMGQRVEEKRWAQLH
ncbi:MAG: cytochrome C oxidase subunit II [Acidobacteriales bacterium]|nr:cytochrome C oxidase subunit II [Terriglobales bacterium]